MCFSYLILWFNYTKYYSFQSNINISAYLFFLRSLAALSEVNTKDSKNMSSESLKNDSEEIIVVHVTEEDDNRWKIFLKKLTLLIITIHNSNHNSDQNQSSFTPPPELRQRKKTTSLITNDVKERRKTVAVASNQSLSLMPDKEKERRNTVIMKLFERHLQKSFLSICIELNFCDCTMFKVQWHSLI